jgi:hypothetical protein
MKKYYIVSLIASFFVAAICLGASATFVSTWSKKDKEELNSLVFSKSSWTYKVVQSNGEEIGKIADETPLDVAMTGFDQVEIVVPNGNIHIIASTGTDAKLTAQNLAEDCQAYVHRNKEELYVKFAKKDKKSEGCVGSLKAELPASMKLRITGGQGDVTVEKWTGEIKVEVGAGKLSILEARGKIRGEVGVGDVLVTGQSSEIKLDVGAGKLDAKLLEKITEGDWKFKIGMGNISVELPNGQTVREKYTTGMGSKTMLNKEKAESEFKVSATSGVGDIVTTTR